MSSSTAQARPRPDAHRMAALTFAPLIMLIAAVLVTNFAGGIEHEARAATVNVSASVTGEKHLAASLCTGGSGAMEVAGATGALTFGALAVNSSTTATCSVGFGSTNSGSVALTVHSASATLTFPAPFAVQGTCAALVAANPRVGIDAAVTGTGTTGTGGTVDCATPAFFQSIPTTAANACTQTGASVDATCAISIGITTGTAAAAGSGVLQVNAA